MTGRITRIGGALALGLALLGAPAAAQAPAQPQDAEYGRLIAQHLTDKRITTELVDHLPASATVPSPLKFFGRIPGTPGELTYAKDIQRYYEELARTSPRVKLWKLGTTEEGRDQIVIAIADKATLKSLDAEKAALARLGDPRRTTPDEAKAIIKTAKPLYWLTSGIHSPETGGPEMLMELAFRLAVEETPFIQKIRDNVVTFITPVVEVDGREKVVDTFYYGKKTGKPRPPLMYWGKYVAHDNNRDGMGQYLKLTQNITAGVLEWRPTVLHDLHEAQSYLYASTGTGPYNPSLDPIAPGEWWQLAEHEVNEMTKRRVPGVFTGGFYDGWVPNYLFWIAMTHNGFGRFYEVQSYGPDNQKDLRLAPTATSREWYRPNPPLPSIDWGPRANVNIQESAILFALNRVATDRELYLENYYMKSRNAVEGGRTGAVNAWIIPAAQRARVNVAEMIDDLRAQGLEVHRADAAFTAGGVSVAAGDYVVRADQPYRTLADMYFSVQNYPAANPRPYDDTGWTMQYMRNVTLRPVKDPAVLTRPMTPVTGAARARGAVAGAGSTLLIEHTGDNALVTLRFRLPKVRMRAAEAAFEAGGRRYGAGTFIVAGADRASVEPVVAELGLRAEAVATAPTVASHELTVPRIGYLHSWLRTQDEGWWRAALDRYGVPYTYLADTTVRGQDLRKRFDVIVYPNVGGGGREQITGVARNGAVPIPYRKTALTPNLGALDQTDDIRGGLGLDGLAALERFVEGGGTLIGDGSTVQMLADFGVAAGVSTSQPPELYTRGAVMRGRITDAASPIVYGYADKELPVYFNEAPVLTVAAGGFGGFGGGGGRGVGAQLAQNTTPNASFPRISPFPAEPPAPARATGAGGDAAEVNATFGSALPTSRTGGAEPTQRPRTVMAFPERGDDILLSGLLVGGQALARKALVVDVPDGRGHMVLFALRPFWRWQTQGAYSLGFNAILNWDHLDAGTPPPAKTGAAAGAG